MLPAVVTAEVLWRDELEDLKDPSVPFFLDSVPAVRDSATHEHMIKNLPSTQTVN